MKLAWTLIAAVFLALPLAAQTEVQVVADVLRIDVGLGLGGIPAHLPQLGPPWQIEDSRDEPGLKLRLARYPLQLGVALRIRTESGTSRICWSAAEGKYAYNLEFREYERFYVAHESSFTNPKAPWGSADIFRSPVEHFSRPYVPAHLYQFCYWILVPRLPADSEERDEQSPPLLPPSISFDDVIKIATEHHARTGHETSKDFLRGLARFIPLETEIETSSLKEFLSSLTLPTGLSNFSDDPLRKIRGLRQAMTREKDSLAIRAHQAMVRSKRQTEFPTIDLAQMDGEDYAVYRQMVENGVFQGSERGKALNMLLDCSADVSAHPMWLDLVASPDFKIAADEKEALLERLEREVSARRISTLLGFAIANLIGLAALILFLRFACARIMFR